MIMCYNIYVDGILAKEKRCVGKASKHTMYVRIHLAWGIPSVFIIL